jgi:methyl-accepting chemotaxis protein
MDSTAILAIAIVTLAAVLIVVGIYAIVILREVHRTAKKVSSIISRVDSVTEAIDSHLVKPGGNIIGILSLLKEGAGILSELRQTSGDLATNSKAVGEEIKKVGRVVKETAPVVAHQAKDVISDAADQGKALVSHASVESKAVVSDAASQAEEATHHISSHAQEVIDHAADQSKEVVNTAAGGAEEVVKAAKQPEPMKAQSLASRRRFFTRR